MTLKYSQEDYKNWAYTDFNELITPTGAWKTVSAFFESGNKTYEPLYTLRIREHRGFPSAYQIIANAKSEYDAAMKICGDWTIWLRLKRSKAVWEGNIGAYRATGLKDGIEAMEARIAGDAIARVIEKSESGDYRASKDLVTWGIPKQKTGKKVNKVVDNQEANIFDIAAKITK